MMPQRAVAGNPEAVMVCGHEAFRLVLTPLSLLTLPGILQFGLMILD